MIKTWSEWLGWGSNPAAPPPEDKQAEIEALVKTCIKSVHYSFDTPYQLTVVGKQDNFPTLLTAGLKAMSFAGILAYDLSGKKLTVTFKPQSRFQSWVSWWKGEDELSKDIEEMKRKMELLKSKGVDSLTLDMESPALLLMRVSSNKNQWKKDAPEFAKEIGALFSQEVPKGFLMLFPSSNDPSPPNPPPPVNSQAILEKQKEIAKVFALLRSIPKNKTNLD